MRLQLGTNSYMFHWTWRGTLPRVGSLISQPIEVGSTNGMPFSIRHNEYLLLASKTEYQKILKFFENFLRGKIIKIIENRSKISFLVFDAD